MFAALLVRHGETDWNRERRIQGWAPTSLTDRGCRQADALGEALSREYGIDRIVASDLRRTRETTERVRRHVDAEVRFDAEWRERDFGICQGFTYEAFDERFPRFSVVRSGRDAVDATPASGESLRGMVDRVIDAWERLVAGAREGETVLVVTHGGPLHAVMSHLDGRDIVEGVLEYDQENCAINEVRLEGDGPRIVSENHTGYR